MKALGRIPSELVFWALALIMLGITEPQDYGSGHHFTLCPLANLGIDWCPGCGIGRAITQLLHGNIAESLKYHWFGVPALLIILYRMITLVKGNKKVKLKFKEEGYV